MGFNIRAKIRQAKKEHSAAQNTKQASKIRRLKSERVKFEGKARLNASEAAEKSRITKAKKAARSNTTLGKLTKAVRQEIKSNKKKRKGRPDLFNSPGPKF